MDGIGKQNRLNGYCQKVHGANGVLPRCNNFAISARHEAAQNKTACSNAEQRFVKDVIIRPHPELRRRKSYSVC